MAEGTGQDRLRVSAAAEFYASVVTCPLHCADVLRDHTRNIPRSFFTRAAPGDPVVLCVTQNPAQALERPGFHAAGASAGVAQRHMDFAIGLMTTPNLAQGNRFTSRTLPMIASVLDVPEAEVLRHAVFTAAVKCGTPGRRRPGPATTRICAQRHLRRELLFWRPWAVLALGRHVGAALREQGISSVFVPHPSHREGEEAEARLLAEARQRIALLRCGDPTALCA